MKKIFFSVLLIIILGVAVVYLPAFYLEWKENQPEVITFEVPDNLSKKEMADFVGERLSWSSSEKREFMAVYSQMQWISFGRYLTDNVSDRLSWSETERETFLTSTSKYQTTKEDPFNQFYVAGLYVLPPAKQTVSFVAGEFISRVKQEKESIDEFILAKLPEEVYVEADEFIKKETELLPDLAPLPPKDIVLEREGAKTLMKFSTIYYNQGEGPLELRAGTSTAEITEDVERDVYQRIFSSEGTYRDKVAGTFLWHQEHLHYHFTDFILYDLQPVDVPEELPELAGVNVKSTFCVRDISKIKLDNLPDYDAKYLVCGKEIQGVSVGWGDTYFYNYPDQVLDLTDLPSGVYRLLFEVNPANRFEELTDDNNISSVLLDIDMEDLTFTILSEEPAIHPEIDHIHLNQTFN